MSEANEFRKNLLFTVLTMISLISVVYLGITLLTGCTLSFQNIDTHGVATDIVDESQAASPVVTPNIQVPI